MSLLERSNAESFLLRERLGAVPQTDIYTSIITYEEHMRGWLAVAARLQSPGRMVGAYERLMSHISTFNRIPLLAFDDAALAMLSSLRKSSVRIGTMDLRIAAIALAHDATVITRNIRDFSKVPGLRVEDWSQTA